MPITRIQWNDDENRKVANRWIDICQREHMDPFYPKGVPRLANEAQQVLPPERQRPENAMKGLTSVVRLMEFVRVAVGERRKQTIVQLKADSSSSQPTKPETVDNIRLLPTASVAATLEKTPTTQASIQNLEALVSAFGQSIAAILVAEISNAIRRTFNEEFPKLHTRALAVSKLLPRILICGPLPKQQPILEESVSGVADLKFVSSEESPKLVNLRGQNCAAVLVWSNFVSHSHQNAARSLFGNDRMIIVSGGIETLKLKIEEVALQIQIPEQNS